MARILALATHSALDRRQLADALRLGICTGCALALIFAARPWPF